MTDFDMFVLPMINNIKEALSKLKDIEANAGARDARLSYASVRGCSIAELDSITAVGFTPAHRAAFTLNELVGTLITFNQSRMYLTYYDALSRKVASKVEKLIEEVPDDAQWVPVAALNEFVVNIKA